MMNSEALLGPLGFGPIEDDIIPLLDSVFLPNAHPYDFPLGSWLPSNTTQSLAISDAPEEMPPTKSSRRMVPNATWEEHKGTLRQLYIVQNLTLEKTMVIMEERHGFKAT